MLFLPQRSIALSFSPDASSWPRTRWSGGSSRSRSSRAGGRQWGVRMERSRHGRWPQAALPPSATSALQTALEQGWPMFIDITFTAVTTLAAATEENITLQSQPVQEQQQHRCFPMFSVSAKDPRHAVTIAAMGLSLDSTSTTKALPKDVGVLSLSDHQSGACGKTREGGCAIALGQQTTVRLSIWASEQSESYIKVRA